MRLRHHVLFVLILMCCLGGMAAAIDWPIAPQDSSHSLGNSYGEYQQYGGYPYYHPGIDILAPAGTPVYAIKSGYVKAILTIAADLHWRVAIGDCAGAETCDGWLYAHLDELSIAVTVGEWVEEGQYLGDLVYWPIAGFHHLHFVKIRNSGVTWQADWEFIANPLDELAVIDDGQPPFFEKAFGTRIFALCQNESASYFYQGDPVSGDVDIICRAGDYVNHTWNVAPYRLEYKIEGDSSIPWTNSVCFTGLLDYDANVTAVYQDDATCDSRGDYDYRRFYFNLTNTDGDSVIEADDRLHAWPTADFHNGDYTLFARAFDRFGNVAVESMTVAVENYFSLVGEVTYSDGNPQLAGAAVEIFPDGQTDITDDAGVYLLTMVGGGSQAIQITRPGYAVFDTVVMMNRYLQINVTLQPGDYVNGDANFDGAVNVGDAVYIVNFVFRSGAVPAPYTAGDANSDETVNVGDAVYLINYIFRDGPPPASM